MMTFCHNMVLIRVFFSGLGIAAARFCAYPVDLDGERMQIEFTTDVIDDELGATAPASLGDACHRPCSAAGARTTSASHATWARCCAIVAIIA